MKTKLWIGLLAGVFIACALSAIILLQPGGDAGHARILSAGEEVCVVDLGVDQSFTVTSGSGGYNVITVRDGKIAVTGGDCPDRYCQLRGYCAGGADIICLPNQLVIQFLQSSDLDAVSG